MHIVCCVYIYLFYPRGYKQLILKYSRNNINSRKANSSLLLEYQIIKIQHFEKLSTKDNIEI